MELRFYPIGEDFPEMPRLERLAKEAFPPEEYLAPAVQLRLAREGKLVFLGLFDGSAFVGYLSVIVKHNIAYLYYLAIDPRFRGQGYGSAALALLESRYPGHVLVVDLEMQDPAAANAAQRASRQAFYRRSSYQATGLYVAYLSMELELMAKGTADPQAMKELLEGLGLPGLKASFFRLGEDGQRIYLELH